MTLNIDGFYRIAKKQSVKKYQLAISSKSKVQQNLLSAAIHTYIYVSALKSGFENGLIIPGFWVRIPEGPPESFKAGHYAWPLCYWRCGLALPSTDVKLLTFIFMINNGNVAKILPSQQMCKSIDIKIGPNLRWSLIQCSGGDEGDRTPDLLTASQALSQLSYAPVRRNTIRELPSRCKDNFEQFCGAWNGCGAERTHDARSILSLQKQTGLLR